MQFLKSRKKVLSISIVVTILFSWGFLTRIGIIPNFLDLEIFCGKKPHSYQHYRKKTGLPPSHGGSEVEYKPVIYLYPTQKLDVQVQLLFDGEIIADYPSYSPETKGWKVSAFPDGKLIDLRDNLEYSYIFWEGKHAKKTDWNLSKGFVIKGSETKTFLRKTLSEMGLTPKEYNEFIVYWFPLMQNNSYNLIHFSTNQYTDRASLKITPKPDCMLRVFMVYKPLNSFIKLQQQEITRFERKGFTVIEWGGTKVD